MGVDNPEFVMVLVKLFGAMIGVFWFLCFCNGLAGNHEPVRVPKGGLDMSREDMYAIATGDEEYLAAHCTLSAPPKPRKRRKSTPKVQTPKPVEPAKHVEPAPPVGPSDELLRDCVGALVTLGTKRAEARQAASKFLVANPHIKTVEAFLPEIFKKR